MELGDIMRWATDNHNYSIVYTVAHDLCLRIINDFNVIVKSERYDGEIEELATYLAEECWFRSLRYYAPVNSWVYYIRSMIGNKCWYYRNTFEFDYDRFYDNFKKRKDDPRLAPALLDISGLHDYSSREFRKFEYVSSIDHVTITKIVDYVFRRYCIYKEDQPVVRYMKYSVMLSISRNETVIYPGLDMNKYGNCMNLIFNALKYYFRKYMKQEGDVVLGDSRF